MRWPPPRRDAEFSRRRLLTSMTSPVTIPTTKARSKCMDKHDALGWVAGFSVPIGTRSMGFRCNDAAACHLLQQQLVTPPAVAMAEVDAVDRLISLRVAPPSTRRGTRNYHVVYAGFRVYRKTLDFEEAKSSAIEAFELESLLVRDDFAHVDSHVFSVEDGSRLVCLTGAEAVCSWVVGQLLDDGVHPEASAFASLGSDGSVFYRSVHRTGPHVHRHGITRLDDFIHLENGDQTRTPASLVLRLFTKTQGQQGEESLRTISKAVGQARVVILPHADRETHLQRVRAVLAKPASPEPSFTFWQG